MLKPWPLWMLLSLVAGTTSFLTSTSYAGSTVIALCEREIEAQIVSRQRLYGTEGTPMWLTIHEGAGPLPGCETLELPIAPSDVLWAGPAGELPDERTPDAVTLQGAFDRVPPTISEVIWHGPEVSEPGPHPQGHTQQAPAPRPDARPSRSAWIWPAETWQEEREALWALHEQENIDELFLTVPVTSEGELSHREELQAFISEASAREIAVWPVIGDPHDVLVQSRPALLNRVEAYAQYNAGVAPDERLAGIQLDIEPYLLPGFSSAVAHWRERYIETIATVHEALDARMALDLVVPVWWGSHPAWGEQLLEPLALPGVSVTVMNYRTDIEALRRGAQPFLEWGSRHGKAVRIGLETGSLPDETRRTYFTHHSEETGEVQEAGGELWLFEQTSPPLLVLLDERRSGLPGKAFAFSHETLFSASHLTFGGDQARLNAVSDELAAEWRVWPSFAGIALHGLDERYLIDNP